MCIYLPYLYIQRFVTYAELLEHVSKLKENSIEEY